MARSEAEGLEACVGVKADNALLVAFTTQSPGCGTKTSALRQTHYAPIWRPHDRLVKG
ncbi:protein of unknown function [Hyphomicrobium sp. 1Nfss2.1]